MKMPSPIQRLADLLLVVADLLRSMSNSDLTEGVISKEFRIAARIEGISVELRELAQSKEVS